MQRKFLVWKSPASDWLDGYALIADAEIPLMVLRRSERLSASLGSASALLQLQVIPIQSDSMAAAAAMTFPAACSSQQPSVSSRPHNTMQLIHSRADVSRIGVYYIEYSMIRSLTEIDNMLSLVIAIYHFVGRPWERHDVKLR